MSEPSVTCQNPAPCAPSSNWRWRWSRASLPVGLLLAAAAVAAVWCLFEPQYEAAALLEITERPENIAFEPEEVAAPKAYIRAQMELIRSQWVLGRTVAIEKIKELPEISKQVDPIEWLRKRISVRSASDSNRFEIRYSSSDPNNSALVVNTVTEQYLAAQAESDAKRTRGIVAALKGEMTRRMQLVSTLRTQVESATQAVSGKVPSLAREAEVNLPFMKDELTQAQKVLERITERLVALQTECRAPSRVRWLNPAEAPEAPVEAVPYRDMAIAGVGAFCLPYATGMIVLTLWYLRKLIHKLLLAGADTAVAPPPSST